MIFLSPNLKKGWVLSYAKAQELSLLHVQFLGGQYHQCATYLKALLALYFAESLKGIDILPKLDVKEVVSLPVKGYSKRIYCRFTLPNVWMTFSNMHVTHSVFLYPCRFLVNTFGQIVI